jgi:pimeloyl-ACP methyl ester carboxylesterase
MTFIPTRNGKLHVLELNPKGDDPIILSHGLYTSIAAFLIEIAPALSKGHRVILYDLRGHGRSSRVDEPYTPGALADDLLHLMDALELPTAHHAGYSYGGTALIHLALHYPERVQRLALVEAAIGVEEGYTMLKTVDDLITDVDRNMNDFAEFSGLPLFNNKMEAIREIQIHIYGNQDWCEVMADANLQLVEETTFMAPKSPTLMLYGNQSPFVGKARTMAEAFPTAKLVVAESDHFLIDRRRDLVTEELIEFFG